MNTDSHIFARQGDIGILHADKVAPGIAADGKKLVPAENGQLTLGHGSATGHRHTVAAKDAELFEHGSDLLLVVHQDTPMLHPEHENKIIPAGRYVVRRQREWLQEEARYVAD